jgi:hypothetical protein
MIYKLKAAGVTLMAAFAVSAIVASVAFAQQGTLTADGPVTLNMTGTVGEVWEGITTFGVRTECPGTIYTGHKLNATPHTSIPSGSTSFTVTPHFVSCQTGGGFHNVTITMNGCDYAFNIGKTVSLDKYAVTADIVCPPGGKIAMHWYAAANEKTLTCTFTVKPQSGLEGLTATTNTDVGDIGLVGTIKGIHVERHGSFCSSLTSAVGEYHMDLTIQGKNEGGGGTGILITD